MNLLILEVPLSIYSLLIEEKQLEYSQPLDYWDSADLHQEQHYKSSEITEVTGVGRLGYPGVPVPQQLRGTRQPPDLLKTQPRGRGRGDDRGSTRRVLDITESNAADDKEDSVLDLTDTNQELLNTKAPSLQIRLK